MNAAISDKKPGAVMRRTVLTLITLLTLTASLAVPAAAQEGEGAEWTAKPLSKLLPGGEEGEEEEVSLIGKLTSREDQDEDGNAITRAFLEQDDGSLIPLPCKMKKDDQGLLEKAAGEVLGGEASCWDYMGQEVELIGGVQSIQKQTKRFRRLTKIARIVPL